MKSLMTEALSRKFQGKSRRFWGWAPRRIFRDAIVSQKGDYSASKGGENEKIKGGEQNVLWQGPKNAV